MEGESLLLLLAGTILRQDNLPLLSGVAPESSARTRLPVRDNCRAGCLGGASEARFLFADISALYPPLEMGTVVLRCMVGVAVVGGRFPPGEDDSGDILEGRCGEEGGLIFINFGGMMDLCKR